MNLAAKDIRFNPTRFGLTALGVAFLMTAAIGMVGLYRGIVADALLIVDGIGADLWVVQGDRAGPFAESSSIPMTMAGRVEGVPGVTAVRRFTQFSEQFAFAGRTHRATITALDYPADSGAWIDLAAGRRLAAARYEAIADVSTGLAVGDRVDLGGDLYTVVGATRAMVDSGGDGLIFVSLNDATTIARRRTSEELLLARAAGDGAGTVRDSKLAAVLVSLAPAVDPAKVAAAMARWGDVNVLTTADQRDLLLNQRLWKLRIQILAFTVLILLITGVVVSLIIYTMTIEKLHEIAMLKLIGARNRVIAAMIGEEAAMIGAIGFVLAMAISAVVFPYFPRRIVIAPVDAAFLAAVLAVICAVASTIGIARALGVNAREVLL